MEYEIVEREEAEMANIEKRGKWIMPLRALRQHQAMKIICGDRNEAIRMGNCALGSFRVQRDKNFKAHYRTVVVNGSVILYIWKD